MEKGILSKKAEKKIGGTYLDDLINAGIFEFIDGQAFAFALKTLDNKFGVKVPEPHQTKIRELIDTIVLDGNYEDAIDEVCDYLDLVIDLPFVDDEGEKDVFKGLAFIIKGIFKLIAKKAA